METQPSRRKSKRVSERDEAAHVEIVDEPSSVPRANKPRVKVATNQVASKSQNLVAKNSDVKNELKRKIEDDDSSQDFLVCFINYLEIMVLFRSILNT